MRSIITVGLAYGDEGKGTIVDALVRKHDATVVVRYNGGAQAAHNVVTPEGKHHTFSQFGSGTFVPGVKTFLSKFMLVNPLAMQKEAEALEKVGVEDALNRMVIDSRALVTTPYHRAANRLRELSRKDCRHGSCGMGIGETAQDAIERGDEAIRVADILDFSAKFRKKLYATHAVMREKIRRMQIVKSPETADLVDKELSTFDVHTDTVIKRYEDWRTKVTIVDKAAGKQFFSGHETAIFEGAQGVLLDENRGFHPYTTWSTTTTRNAYSVLVDFEQCQDTHEIGILRPYATRHGPGPFITEDEMLRPVVSDDHNTFNDWQRNLRVGWFDGAMLDYALRINGPVDSLAITHIDKLPYFAAWKMCHDYGFPVTPGADLREQKMLTEWLSKARPDYDVVCARDVMAWISAKAKTPISLTSFGPKSHAKKFA